jgi:hypothetical protein
MFAKQLHSVKQLYSAPVPVTMSVFKEGRRERKEGEKGRVDINFFLEMQMPFRAFLFMSHWPAINAVHNLTETFVHRFNNMRGTMAGKQNL